MKENKEYKVEALESLRGNWPQAVLAVLVIMAVAIALSLPLEFIVMGQAAVDPMEVYSALSVPSFLTNLACLLVLSPIVVGAVNSYKVLVTERDGRVVRNMFTIGFRHYWTHVWAYLLRMIYTALWSLLLIVPGIVKSLSYAMTFYILEDYPELSANKAIELSMDMMKGRKFDLFYLYLSFIGWFILCLFTLGIGYLWLVPYAESAQAVFYEDVKRDYLARKALERGSSAPAAAQAPVAETIKKEVPRVENPEDYMPK